MNRSFWVNKAVFFLIAPLFMFLAGCAVPFHKKLDAYVANNEFDKASALIETEKTENKEHIYNEKNELLYLMDMGAVKQMEGDYKASSSFLTKAEDKIEELYTRSAMDETYSFISNDLSIKYTGTEPEQVMVNVLMALNYMYQGKWEDAQIEAKRVNNRLNMVADKLGERAFYADDGFVRYLAGYSYEAMGNINDAYISYKKSLASYQRMGKEFGISPPDSLKADLIRTANALGFTDEAEKYKAEFNGIALISRENFEKSGELMLVIYDGLPPFITDSNGSPVYNRRGPAIMEAKVIAGETELQVPVTQDLQEIQIKLHEMRWGERFMKGIGRGIAKELVKSIPIANLFVQPERADTRSWRTLPGKFRIIRLGFKPGHNTIKLQVINRRGDKTVYTVDFDIEAGMKKAMPFYIYNDGTIEPYTEK